MIPAYDPVGAHGEAVPSHGSGPGINAFAHHMIREHPGTTNLGIYGDRNIRGGSSKSLHAVGRAFDWGYTDRADAERVFNTLVANNAEMAGALGIQAVHDYYLREGNGSRWSHPARARSWGHGRGIHWANVGPGGEWLHIEFTVEAANDPDLMGRVLRDTIATDEPGLTAALPPPPPEHKEHDMIILDLNEGTDWWVAMLLAGNELTHLVNGHHVKVMERAHVPRVKVNEVEVEGVLYSVQTTNASPFAAGPAHNAHLDDIWNGVLSPDVKKPPAHNG